MTLRQIKKYETKDTCTHPEHNSPTMIVLQPGEYEHTCPGCGKKDHFSVPLVTC